MNAQQKLKNKLLRELNLLMCILLYTCLGIKIISAANAKIF